ncbi:hypothetical protein D7V86_24830 [bacterium D16-51]|nr:hypothetical protein D7V96_23460 [bacterium D16-59]RKI53605.1 hypothetical protein D7V86_24830 [bacterium D16-51]
MENINVFISRFEVLIFAGITLFLFGLLTTKILLKQSFVRKRIIGNKKLKYTIYLLFLDIYLLILLSFIGNFLAKKFLQDINQLVFILYGALICLLLFSVTEQMLYTVYRFSHIRIYLENGNVIECDNVSKIRRKSDVLAIELEEKTIRIKYNQVCGVEYYGEPLIIIDNLDIAKKYRNIK